VLAWRVAVAAALGSTRRLDNTSSTRGSRVRLLHPTRWWAWSVWSAEGGGARREAPAHLVHIAARQVSTDVSLRLEPPLAQQAAPSAIPHSRQRFAANNSASRYLELLHVA